MKRSFEESLPEGCQGTSRDTSDKIKKNEHKDNSQHTHSKSQYSIGRTSREKTEDTEDFNSPSGSFPPTRGGMEKPVLGSQLDYDKRHKQKDGEEASGSNNDTKAVLGFLQTLQTHIKNTKYPKYQPPGLGPILATLDISYSDSEDSLETLLSKRSADDDDDDDKPSGEEKPQMVTHHFLADILSSQAQLQPSSYVTRAISCHMPRSHSVSSLSKIPGAKNKLTRSNSFPDLLFKEFTPVITTDFDDETYRFQCSRSGLYQCTVTGLVFHMEGGGGVVYRTVPWDRRQLSRHHKKPAGPLFDIQCVQQCVCQLHLPHCEILSTGGHQFLSVAHVTDEGIEFIRPQKITETHVVLNITGFSGYGNVKDEDSPPDPVRALVLLFYRPSKGAFESVLNVLLVPRNIVVQDVQRIRRKLVGEEMYIEKPPHCKLQPKQLYTLSACPQNRSVRIEPAEAEFDEESHSSYFPNFQVTLRRTKKNIKLVLKDKSSSLVAWERQVCLVSTELRKSSGQLTLDLPSIQRLRNIQNSFIDGISEPVLQSLLDKLWEKTVITDPERESVEGMDNRRDKARFVIDVVRKKGEAACSEMIEFLCEVDPFLCGHLGLM